MDHNHSVKNKSLEKTLAILECFSKTRPELGVTEISKQLGLYKSNVYNILNTLSVMGYIDQNPQTGKYRLGLKILELANIITNSNGFRQSIYPLLNELSVQLGEVVYYGIPSDGNVIYLDAAYPTDTPVSRVIIGDTAPMYCTAIGKAMLAYFPEKEADDILSRPFQAFTPNTITSVEQMKAELQSIRKSGYSIDDMEHEHGIKCVGVPIFDANGIVVAAISASGPSLRFEKNNIMRCASLLRETANQIHMRHLV
jgi:DNA-binding IclR family transcriptional regulator